MMHFINMVLRFLRDFMLSIIIVFLEIPELLCLIVMLSLLWNEVIGILIVFMCCAWDI
jgi:hypothetical protein